MGVALRKDPLFVVGRKVPKGLAPGSCIAGAVAPRKEDHLFGVALQKEPLVVVVRGKFRKYPASFFVRIPTGALY